jgi:hypothetical protein
VVVAVGAVEVVSIVAEVGVGTVDSEAVSSIQLLVSIYQSEGGVLLTTCRWSGARIGRSRGGHGGFVGGGEGDSRQFFYSTVSIQ